MELEDLNLDFAGLSEETKKAVLESLQGVSKYAEMYEELNKICVDRYEGVNIGTLCAKMIQFSQDLCKSLAKAKSEAVLPSDKEEIEELQNQFMPILEFSKGVGEAMLDLPEEVIKDDDISTMIGACLV